MTKQQQDVKTFMQTFGQKTPMSPTSPDAKTRELRVKLLLEEVLELAAASGVNVTDNDGNSLSEKSVVFIEANNSPVDMVGVADALADIDYVNQGAAVAYGLNLEPFQDEVHRSNMTKLWLTGELETAKQNAYTIKPVDAPGDRCWLVKNSDGKVVKSPSYSKADLQKVMDAQLNSASASL